jgi:hypothetical protein
LNPVSLISTLQDKALDDSLIAEAEEELRDGGVGGDQ